MSSFRLHDGSLEPILGVVGLLRVNHVPLLRRHWLALHLTALGGGGLSGLKNAKIREVTATHHKLFILLLQLLFNCLLIEPDLLII